MNICMVIPSMMAGGAERTFSILCNGLNREGNRIFVVLTENAKDILFEFDENVKIIDATGPDLGLKNYLIRMVNVISRTILDNKINIVVSFITRTNIASIIAARKCKVPVIVSERNNPYLVPSSKAFRQVRDIVYRWTTGAVFQTEHAQKYFAKSVVNKSTIIMNPVSPLVDAYRSKDIIKNNVFVSACRLEPQKNISMMIDAFAQIADSIPEYKLIIYGEGGERDKAERLINKYGLSDRILLPGVNKQVIGSVAEAKIFLLSSDFEGLSNAINEALCVGTPCIATDSPTYGNRMMIQDGINGYLVKVGDVKAMAEKMLFLARNIDQLKAMSSNAQRLYEKTNVLSIVGQWSEYIEEVVKKSKNS